MTWLFYLVLGFVACGDGGDDSSNEEADADTDADSDTDADTDADTDTDPACTPTQLCDVGGSDGLACQSPPFGQPAKVCAAWYTEDKNCAEGTINALLNCQCGCLPPPKEASMAPTNVCDCLKQCFIQECAGDPKK